MDSQGGRDEAGGGVPRANRVGSCRDPHEKQSRTLVAAVSSRTEMPGFYNGLTRAIATVARRAWRSSGGPRGRQLQVTAKTLHHFPLPSGGNWTFLFPWRGILERPLVRRKKACPRPALSAPSPLSSPPAPCGSRVTCTRSRPLGGHRESATLRQDQRAFRLWIPSCGASGTTVPQKNSASPGCPAKTKGGEVGLSSSVQDPPPPPSRPSEPEVSGQSNRRHRGPRFRDWFARHLRTRGPISFRQVGPAGASPKLFKNPG